MSKTPPKKKPTTKPRTPRRPARSVGAGSEPAQGIHGAGRAAKREKERAPHVQRSGVAPPRAGSEPLHHRSVEHASGYGGEGGLPRTSSHERQKFDADDATRGGE